ncbi:hypothetical protein [Pseudogracilibacillus sp. SO10305]
MRHCVIFCNIYIIEAIKWDADATKREIDAMKQETDAMKRE